jgi:acyl-CoA thioesterase FadM
MRSAPQQAPVFPVTLQRNAFGPRLTARAGDVWRAMQDVVVDQSSSVGWTPERYVEADLMFIVRTMTVVHRREVTVAEPLHGRTWVSRARRDMLFTREVRLFASAEVEPLATATQEWALLTRALAPTRATKALYDAFTIVEGFPSTELPSFVAQSHSWRATHAFSTWHVWMDPHGHVNHAAYVDYCDESLARAVAKVGLDAQALVPVAEAVHFKAAIGAQAEVVVETAFAGHAADAGVFTHRVMADGKLCATATTVRKLVGVPGWFEPVVGSAR